jgi:hypothetical protein
MKYVPVPVTQAPWRGLLDARSTRPVVAPVYKILLKDRRSTR